MTIKLSTKGGGGVAKIRYFSGALVAAKPISGTVISITPPTGQIAMLTGLASRGNFGLETGVTISVGGADVISGLSLDDDSINVAGTFAIASPSVDNAAGASIGVFSPISGNVDESIVVKKDSGSTINDFIYSYAFAEI